MRGISYLTAAAPKDSAAAHFDLELGKELHASQRKLLVLLVAALSVDVANMVVTYDAEPGWRSLVPCTFQTQSLVDALDSVMKGASTIQRSLNLFPMVLLLLVVGRSMVAGTLHIASKFPLRTFVLAWIWRTLVVLLLYSTANIKLLTRYESITQKSCEVTLSLLFYPPGQLQVLNTSYAHLRNVTARYFANPRNHIELEYPGLEAWLSGIAEQQVPTVINDLAQCDLSSEESRDEIYLELYKYTTPNTAILGYCAQVTLAPYAGTPPPHSDPAIRLDADVVEMVCADRGWLIADG